MVYLHSVLLAYALELICPSNDTYTKRFMCRYETKLSVNMLHMKSLQSALSQQALVYMHFTLLVYAPEYIYLPHQTCMPHYTSNIVYMYIPHYWTYKSNKTKNFSFIYHAVSIYILLTNISLKCHIYAKLNAMKNVTLTTGMHTFHITGICPWINMPFTLNMCVLLHFSCSLHIDSVFLHKSIKINKLQNILTKLLQNVCQESICPSNATCMPHAKITWHIYGGSMPTGTHCKKPLWSKLWSVGRAYYLLK